MPITALLPAADSTVPGLLQGRPGSGRQKVPCKYSATAPSSQRRPPAVYRGRHCGQAAGVGLAGRSQGV